MKEKILELLIKLGLLKEEQKQAVQNELDKIVIEPGKDKNNDDQNNAKIEALTAQVKSLTELITKEQELRNNGIKAQEEIIKTDREKKITDAINKAILVDKKYPEGKREYLTKLANSDFALFEETVKDAPVNKHFTKDSKDGKDTKDSKTDFTQQTEINGFKPAGTIGKHIAETGNFVG